MKIVFVKAYDYPVGGAPQNRSICICKGLIEQSHEVEVHVYAPAKMNIDLNLLKTQVYQGVRIYNHAWRWSPSKSRLQQYLGIVEGLSKTMIALYKSNRRKKIDYIFMGAHKNMYIFPIFVLTKLFGAKLGRGLSEYPISLLMKNKYFWFKHKYRMLTNYRWYDVVYIMTHKLEEYYRPFLKKKSKILHLPMTVDFDRFPYPSTDFIQSKYITYCGDLSQKKDGVLTLIESFANVKDEFSELKLRLIGNNNDEKYMTLLRQHIDKHGVLDRVILTGYVNPNDIPDELYKSRLLVLARPDNLQAAGGFPTKLGEYLATGIPVVVTKVGEIPVYLKDGINAYVAEPDNIRSITETIIRALDDNNSYEVGLAGRNTAMQYFSHSVQGKYLSEFLSL